MKIERVRDRQSAPSSSPNEATETGGRGRLASDGEATEARNRHELKALSPELQLLKSADKKRRAWRRHCHAYGVTNLALIALNGLGAVMVGLTAPWSLVPAIGWGVGFMLHGLGYRAWKADHAEALARAEAYTGLGTGTLPLLLPSGLPEKPPLLFQCRVAVKRTEEALLAVGSPATNLEEVQADLRAGLENVERLLIGVERIEETLNELAPGGPEAMKEAIQRLDQRINETKDSKVRAVHHQNRALLLARQAKIRALESDRARMIAHAEGFLLAAENLRLDTVRLGHEVNTQSLSALTEPIRRLSDEVEVLERVEAELSRL